MAGAIPCSVLGAGTIERSEHRWGWVRLEGSEDLGARLAGGPGFGEWGPPRREGAEQISRNWRDHLWARWMAEPSWFIPFRNKTDTFSPELRNGLWPRGETGSVWIWESPGEGLIYVSREDVLADTLKTLAAGGDGQNVLRPQNRHP